MAAPRITPTLPLLALFLGLSMPPALPAAAVVLGQVDDFQALSVADWTEGVASPNPPAVVVMGGPGGAGDAYLENVSSGLGGSGSKMVMFNKVQWTGDYLSAGVGRIELSLANFGSNDLAMRVAVGNGSTWYASTEALPLLADGQWLTATFGLSDLEMSPAQGGAALGTVLGNVIEMRILSAAGGPTQRGDDIAATLGVDDITALAPVCNDGLDNDSDGSIDFPADNGCADSDDPSEERTCSDGFDNDDDGFVDFGDDPGCRTATSKTENPQCQDGVNNDPAQDPAPGLIDFDGGQSIFGDCFPGIFCPPGVSDPDTDGVANPDPQCVQAFGNKEKFGCGLGFELLWVLAPLLRTRRRSVGA